MVGMSKRRKDNDIIVSSLGSSTNVVTGSCFTVSYPKDDGTRGLIVLEAGLDQSGNSPEEQYNNNKKMLDNIGKKVVSNSRALCILHPHV